VGVCAVEPCADVILSAAARRVILTGGGGVPIDFFRRCQLNGGDVAGNSKACWSSSVIFITSCTSWI